LNGVWVRVKGEESLADPADGKGSIGGEDTSVPF
jgi:hypothetical protein